MSIVADQRKRNPNQPRPNVASQNNTPSPNPSKKGNKQSQAQNQQNQQNQQNTPKTAPAPPKSKSPPLPLEEVHVPLEGFNAEDVDKLLQASFDAGAEHYQPERASAQKAGPWAQKQGTMATGKDFFLELRKQVATLQKGESTNKGG